MLFREGRQGARTLEFMLAAGHPPMMRLALQEGSTGERQLPKAAALSETRHGAASPHETDRTRGRVDERKGNGNDG